MKKPDDLRPPITVKTYNTSYTVFEGATDGPNTLVIHPDTPLSRGAKVWIDTEAWLAYKDAYGEGED